MVADPAVTSTGQRPWPQPGPTATPDTLAYWRQQAGLTQSALATRLGINRSAIGAWETRRSRIPPKHHAALSAILDIPPGREPWPPPTAGPDTLAYWRQQAGLTQSALATRLGVSRSAVTAWETRRAPIPPRHHAALSAILGIPPGQEPWPPPPPPAGPDTLTYWRQQAGLTQVALCTRLGLNSSAVGEWEQGDRPIPAKHHAALSDLLGIPPGQEPWPPPPPPAGPDTLTYWRQQAGLTQTDLATRLGVSPSTVGVWERGHSPIPPRHHAALSDMLGIPPDREPWPPPPPPAGPDTLTYWRQQAGLTQVALCTALGLNPSTVNKWERGHSPIPPRHHAALSDMLGIPPGQEPWPPAPPPSPTADPDTLTYWRQQAGLTQVALATQLGLNPSTVGVWERGHSPIPAKHHAALSAMLGIPPGQEPWPPPSPTATPDTLTYWRQQAGLTQVALATQLGLNPSTVNKWERGDRPIPAKHHAALSDILDIPPGQEPWPPPPPPAGPDTLTYWRQQAGLTQVALATQLGLNRSAIAAWETRRSPIPAKHHAALSDILDIPPGQEPWTQ